MVVALFVGVFVARHLGPIQFGLLSYANSFVALFGALATLGLDGVVVRELCNAPQRRDELLGTAFWLKIGGATLSWILIAVTLSLVKNDIQTNILIAVIASAVIFQAFNVIDLNYQAEVKSKYVVRVQLIQLTISSIVKLVLIFIDARLIWFALVYSLDAMILACGLAVVYLRNTGKFWYWKWRNNFAKRLLQDSWPAILSAASVSAYMQIDQVMIKSMLSAEQVGLYSAAVKLSKAWYFIPVAITMSVFPAIINAQK